MSSSPATARILIKGGKVVNDDCTQEADVYIENGVIQQVGKELMIPGGAKVIDASGKLVLPGGIDTSVHLDESFMNATAADDFYSGTKQHLTRMISQRASDEVIMVAGKVVHGETTTAHAVLSGMQYYHQDWAHAAAHVTVPPLRLDPNTPNYMMSLLGNDTLNAVASDHRPFTVKQRAMGKDDFTKIPHGLPGVQDRMSVLWEKGVVGGKMDENRFVAVTSSNAAKIYNLYPRKGKIIPGADADVVVWDPEGSKTISVSNQVQGGDVNLYEGLRCHGVPLVTISRGRLVYENGIFACAEGSGKFCPLRTFPDHLYKKMVQREKSQAVKAVEREPYTGEVVPVLNSGKREPGVSDLDTPTRPCTRHGGVRDLQGSSFSLSGAQIDDKVPKRSSARILAPPGGRSSGIW
ncbi:Dihydropyrimidinase-related protein 5 [Liparis tanakae]|uniref:Dihydropyrimidinase-related protein 5 n=1 Tax=Liparis tanakae TaxID=230148 RepID=A0A4Z2J589_9TELE|nr:Dihydropyrimidinase-related protein 5 [Liparis tanakae]